MILHGLFLTLLKRFTTRKNILIIEICLRSLKCTTTESKSIAIIYPHQNANVIIPKGMGIIKIVMEAAQTNNDKALFWHLDGTYIGSTLTIHKMSVEISPGNHSLSIIDKNGNTDLVNLKLTSLLKTTLRQSLHQVPLAMHQSEPAIEK